MGGSEQDRWAGVRPNWSGGGGVDKAGSFTASPGEIQKGHPPGTVGVGQWSPSPSPSFISPDLASPRFTQPLRKPTL